MRQLGWIFRLALVIGAGSLLVTATVAAVAPRMWRIANAHTEEPVELPEFADLAQRSYAYDSLGQQIAVFELENSQPVALDDVPDQVIEAFLAVEDNEFYSHNGVNVRSLLRATLSNFASDGPIQGASTITMQVVKNDFMAGFPRDGRYKALQITYAVRLEKQATKAEILERYLNTVFFGQNSYGIGAAAETYFGKEVGELTVLEAGFLAGLVQAPTTYDPILNPVRSRNRFGLVLDRLLDVGLIGELERGLADELFIIPERVLRRDEQANRRTYYTEALRDYLLNRSDILGETYDERYQQLHRGGLRIHTTLDPTLQARAENARDQLPDNASGIDAAITSLDTSTGAIRAMVGGSGFVPGQDEVNLALAPSQTGSSVKLFILAAALQAGAHPEDTLNGTHPCTLPDPNLPGDQTFELRGGVNGGVATVRRHTVRSINCAFARLSQIVGLNRVVDTIYRMAANPYLRRDTPPEEREPMTAFANLAIGSNELSTLDMAAGIQSIANEGVHHEPYYVEFVDDAEGNRLYTHFDTGDEVLSRQASLRAIDIMKGVLTSGTARRTLAEYAEVRPAFGKTGTQDSNWTATFAGATPELSTAVLVRNPDLYVSMRNIPEFVDVGVPRVQGGTFPALIWRTYNEQADLDFADFPDWSEPADQQRSAGRLYLPGDECLYDIVGYRPGGTVPPAEPEPVEGFASPQAPPTTTPGEAPPETAPPATLPRVPVYGKIESGTTIPPDVLDPNAPLPSVPSNQIVRSC